MIDPRVALEEYEFEGNLQDKIPILVQPSFWLEFETFGTLDGIPTTHGVWVVSHSSSSAHDSPVRENIVVERMLRVKEDQLIKSHQFTD